jgi:predicted RNA-binding Zn-ribbon protein involved in translation (DUF1610 family)
VPYAAAVGVKGRPPGGRKEDTVFTRNKWLSTAAALIVLVYAVAPAGAGGDGGGPTPAGDVAAQADNDGKTADVWENVRISNAYGKLKCPNCGATNDLRAARCRRCGYLFPQPSPDVTDPSQVFVPGKGYYREGTLLEPGRSRALLWVPGLVLGVVGLSTMSVAAGALTAEDNGDVDTEGARTALWVGSGMTAGGLALTIIGVTYQTEAVYAYARPAGRPAVTRAGGSGDVTFKFSLSFGLM